MLDDKYGYIAVANVIKEKTVLGVDHRLEYVRARKDYYKAVLAMSDVIDDLSGYVIDSELIHSDKILIPLGHVAYAIQRYITTLASQSPLSNDVNDLTLEDPYTTTAKQFNNGYDEWEQTILINLETAMVTLNISSDEPTYFGLEFFTSAMLNADNPDVIISMYLNLVKYLEKFDLIKIETINAAAEKM